MEIDRTNWSGEGTFTQVLLDTLQAIAELQFVRVEDATSARSDADYNLISNEIFVHFHVRTRREVVRRFGVLPLTRVVQEKAMSLAGLAGHLAGVTLVGEPDYADEGMAQYLRTERVVPPYQTRGYKLVELVRIYEV